MGGQSRAREGAGPRADAAGSGLQHASFHRRGGPHQAGREISRGARLPHCRVAIPGDIDPRKPPFHGPFHLRSQPSPTENSQTNPIRRTAMKSAPSRPLFSPVECLKALGRPGSQRGLVFCTRKCRFGPCAAAAPSWLRGKPVGPAPLPVKLVARTWRRSSVRVRGLSPSTGTVARIRRAKRLMSYRSIFARPPRSYS